MTNNQSEMICKMKYQDRQKLKMINDFIDQHIDYGKNYYYQMGYRNFGILLFGFCRWLHEQNLKENNEIFFLARDGYIVKKAYSILYKGEKTHYLYASRRSLVLPRLINAQNVDDVLDAMSVLLPMFTIETFLSVLEIRIDDVLLELKESGIDLDDQFRRSNFKNNPKLRIFVEKIFDRIKLKAKKQNKILKAK